MLSVNFADWKFWVVLATVVIGFIFGMQYMNQTPPMPEKAVLMQELEQQNQIIVIVYAVNEVEMKKIVEADYPNYRIKEVYYDDRKQRFVIRLERKE